MITANDLTAGTRFLDPDYGILTAVCDRGLCTHDKRDSFSVHVRWGRSEFFNAYNDDDTFDKVEG